MRIPNTNHSVKDITDIVIELAAVSIEDVISVDNSETLSTESKAFLIELTKKSCEKRVVIVCQKLFHGKFLKEAIIEFLKADTLKFSAFVSSLSRSVIKLFISFPDFLIKLDLQPLFKS